MDNNPTEFKQKLKNHVSKHLFQSTNPRKDFLSQSKRGTGNMCKDLHIYIHTHIYFLSVKNCQSIYLEIKGCRAKELLNCYF